MVVLTIIFIITIIITLYIYVKNTEPSKRLEFSSLSTLLQTLFVFITLWITIYTINSSSSDTQKLFDNLQNFNSQFSKMDSSLGSVSSKLKKMPEQIEKFSNSIDSLNFITNKQSEKFEENTHKLNATIKSLSNSVNEYEKNINNYSSKLESIVKLTNQQLEIWKEQQRVLLDEFSRKPILKLELKEYSSKKDTSYITDFILKNSGNIESSIRAIFIAIPSDMILTFKSESFIKYKTLDNSVTYRFEPSGTNVEIVSAGSSTILPCVMKLLRKKVVEGIAYRIDYYSKYDSGNKNDNIIFK